MSLWPLPALVSLRLWFASLFQDMSRSGKNVRKPGTHVLGKRSGGVDLIAHGLFFGHYFLKNTF